MINNIKAYFKSEKLPRWFKIFNLSLLLPILLWPFVFYTTIFFFDNPTNYGETFFYFLLVNAYPLYLFIIVFWNSKLYNWNKFLGLLLPITFLITMFSGSLYIGYRMYDTLRKAEQKKIEMEKNGILGGGFIKKNNHIYLNDTIVQGADPNTFEIISWYWSRDNKMYFYLGKPVPQIDYATFKLLDYHYAKDKNHVFYDDIIIQGADANTFHHIDGTNDGKDAENCYRWGEKVDCSILLTEE